MPDETLDQQTTLTDPAGATFYALKGGADYEIAYSDLFNAVNTAISALQSQVNGIEAVHLFQDQSANFSQAYGALTKFISVDFRHKSGGTATVRVGTSSGGSEISPDLPVAAGLHLNITVMKSFESATTLYFTISGGTVDVEITYKLNRFTP